MRFRPLSRLSGLLLVLLSSAAWATDAGAASPPRLQMRDVVLTGKAEPVRVSTRVPTTLTFDTPLDARALKPGEGAPIELLAVGERSLTVRALAPLREAVTLHVPLLGASGQTVAVFALTPDEDTVDAQVLVFLAANAPERLQARLAECEARCAACEAALASQREQGRATSPADWVLSGQVTSDGIRVSRYRTPRVTSPEGLSPVAVLRFQAKAWMVLSMSVKNDSGRPWRPGTAWLEMPATGRHIEARTVVMEPEVLPPGGTGVVAAEFGWKHKGPGPPGEDSHWVIEAADGTRSMSIQDLELEQGTVEREQRLP